jgi:hypothetical protein
MRTTPYWKAMFSPFRRLTLKVYAGKTAVGMPYFYPRKLVPLSETEVYELADKDAVRLIANGQSYDYATILQNARRQRKFVNRRFGFDYIGLGYKTKWSNTDYRFEWSPRLSFVCFGYQIAVTVVPKLPKDISIDYYWESWLYYNYNTDATKTPKERIAEAREAKPLNITTYRKGEEPITYSVWDMVLKKRYL